MEFEAFSKQMKVLEYLISNKHRTQKDICDEVGISRRTFFRYIENYRYAGFEILSSENVFSVSIDSPFLNKINNYMYFSEEEIQFIASCIMGNVDDASAMSLKNKLRRVYGIDIEREANAAKVEDNKMAKLTNAINEKKMVVLEKYSSPHSQSESDRLVEPYLIVQSRGEVRCFEISSKMCKTFKIARIKRVKVLDEGWQFKKEHKNYFTDIFGFSGEEEIRIKMRVGYLARRILMEEYGVPKRLFIEDGDKHWIYYCRVCNFQGIARFVLGLASDVEIIGNEDFKAYLRENIRKMSEKFE